VYICQICNKVAAPNTPSFLVPQKIRKRRYPFRPAANKLKDPRKPGKRKYEYRDDPGGTGYETVREIRFCPACAGKTKMPAIE